MLYTHVSFYHRTLAIIGGARTDCLLFLPAEGQ